MDDLICRGILILVILAGLFLIYKIWFSRGYWDHGDGPIILDARNDESVIIEAGSIAEQRKSARERGGPITLTISQEPSDYSAQLNLRTLRKSNGVTIIQEDKSDGQQR